jgi:NAD-dependent SIR2 family protein deacetylase
MEEEKLGKRIERLVDMMRESNHMVVFTGAGISTESGLPDFRGPNGLWTKMEKGFPTDKVNWEVADPNPSHYALVELQNIGKLGFLVTQNIDNLHLKAGIKPELIAELHGNVTRVKCSECEREYNRVESPEKCSSCGGKLRPSVVDFGEALPRKALQAAYHHSRLADLFLVLGSSLVVAPASYMPEIALESGAKLCIVNREPTPLDSNAHLRFFEKIGEVLPGAVEELKRSL